MKIGIVTPTFRRERFLPRFVQNIIRQDYTNWELLIVHDGPGPSIQRRVEPICEADARIHFFETQRKVNRSGAAPRLFALREFLRSPQPPDYVVFWDDDNKFYTTALTTIVHALQAENFPDLLLVSFHQGLAIRPNTSRPIDQMRGDDIDSAMLVARLAPALRNYEKVFERKIPRGQDYAFFHYLREEGGHRMVSVRTEPIGRYDGLRFFCTLRWKLGIPPLHLSERRWFRPLRQFLRG